MSQLVRTIDVPHFMSLQIRYCQANINNTVSLGVRLYHHPVPHIRIQVDAPLKPNRVSGQKPPRRGVKVTVRQQQQSCLPVGVVTPLSFVAVWCRVGAGHVLTPRRRMPHEQPHYLCYSVDARRCPAGQTRSLWHSTSASRSPRTRHPLPRPVSRDASPTSASKTEAVPLTTSW